MPDEIPDIIKDMAAALTSATEVQNRYWIAAALTSVFVVIPRSEPSGLLPLPFGLPSVDEGWFALLGLLLLSALITAFASAEARLVRTQNLFFRVLEERRNRKLTIAGEDERDFLDALRKPSLGTVAPLAQVVRGRYQFFSDTNACPSSLLTASKWLYVLLKLPAMVIWLLLPGLGLTYGAVRYHSVSSSLLPGPLGFLPWILVAAAAVALSLVAWQEAHYAFVVLRRIWSD